MLKRLDAVEGALTGRLVVSTLPAREAAAVPFRLVDMGVEPSFVTAALTCAVSQRLARRLCSECSRTSRPHPGSGRPTGVSRPVGGHGRDSSASGLRTLWQHRLSGKGRALRSDADDRAARSARRPRCHEPRPRTLGDLRGDAHPAGWSRCRRVADGVLGVDEMLRVLASSEIRRYRRARSSGLRALVALQLERRVGDPEAGLEHRLEVVASQLSVVETRLAVEHDVGRERASRTRSPTRGGDAPRRRRASRQVPPRPLRRRCRRDPSRSTWIVSREQAPGRPEHENGDHDRHQRINPVRRTRPRPRARRRWLPRIRLHR